MSVAYDELVRLRDAGAAAPTDENLERLGITSEDLDRAALGDAEDTFDRVIPAMTGVPAEALRMATHVAMPPEAIIGLLATHTATGILLGMALARARRG